MSVKPLTLLEKYRLTAEDICSIAEENPPFRSILLGYSAEHNFKKELAERYQNITDLGKPSDTDRRTRGDRRVTYRGREFVLEIKSLQTHTAKLIGKGEWSGKVQCDASDNARSTSPGGVDRYRRPAYWRMSSMSWFQACLPLAKSGDSRLRRTPTCPGQATGGIRRSSASICLPPPCL